MRIRACIYCPTDLALIDRRRFPGAAELCVIYDDIGGDA